MFEHLGFSERTNFQLDLSVSFSFIDGNFILSKSASELQPELKVMQFLLRHDYCVVKQCDNRLILPRALFSIFYSYMWGSPMSWRISYSYRDQACAVTCCTDCTLTTKRTQKVQNKYQKYTYLTSDSDSTQVTHTRLPVMTSAALWFQASPLCFKHIFNLPNTQSP